MNPAVQKAKTATREEYPLRLIVTGMEHSGTTILANLLKFVPDLDGGFECGLLLANSPSDFKNLRPWYDWMQHSLEANQWGLKRDQMDELCLSNDWEEAYRKLIEFSPRFRDKKQARICDKTPPYLLHLDTVLEKIPDFVPCVVIEKSPENLWRSYRRRQMNFIDFIYRYEVYHEGLRRGISKFSDRILVVSYEELCKKLLPVSEKVFSFAGLPFLRDEIVEEASRVRDRYDKSIRNERITLSDRLKLRLLAHRFRDVKPRRLA